MLHRPTTGIPGSQPFPPVQPCRVAHMCLSVTRLAERARGSAVQDRPVERQPRVRAQQGVQIFIICIEPVSYLSPSRTHIRKIPDMVTLSPSPDPRLEISCLGRLRNLSKPMVSELPFPFGFGNFSVHWVWSFTGGSPGRVRFSTQIRKNQNFFLTVQSPAQILIFGRIRIRNQPRRIRITATEGVNSVLSCGCRFVSSGMPLPTHSTSEITRI